MAKGILGRKLGMAQVFDEDGRVVPVTVVEAGPCRVYQVRTLERDGYSAVQLGLAQKRRPNKPEAGHAVAAGAKAPTVLREIRLGVEEAFEVGAEVRVDIFGSGERVDVIGTSRGKGFAGSIRRHGFHRGPMTHGSKYHRGPGSLAPRISGGGGKVHKGRRLPGRLGGVRVTVQNLEVVRSDLDRNLILIRGAIPGPRGSLVTVVETVKRRRSS